MKYLTILPVFLAALALAAAEITITPERPEALYRCGETTGYTLTVTAKDGRPLRAGKLHAIFTRDSRTPVARRSFDLAKEEPPYVAQAALNEPGFLRMAVMLEEPGEKPQYKIAAAGYEPEKLLPGMPEPEDFMQFWRDGQRKLRETPADIRLTPIPEFTKPDREVYRLSVGTLDGQRVYGFLTIPKKGKAKYPALVNVPGAGPGIFADVMLADQGFVVLNMNVLPYPVPRLAGESRAKYDEYLKAGGHYKFRGVPDRDRYHFRNVYLGIDRAIDYLAERPEVDARNIGIFGSSQGGGSAIILAALNAHIKAAVANVPALCDHGAPAKGRAPGWPLFADEFKNDPAALEMARYFDAANFAAHLKCPVRVIVGFIDPVCSPSSVYAMYNRIPTDKKIVNEPLMGHATRMSYTRAKAWLFDQLTPPQVPGWPESVELAVGDLGLRLESRSFWTLYRIDYKGDRLGVDQWGSHYGNVFSFREYGFVGSGHRENENERILSLALEVDGKPVERPAPSIRASAVKLVKRSMVRGLEVTDTLEIADNRITETVHVTCRSPERLGYAFFCMYPWATSFTLYRALDEGTGGSFTDSGEFLLNSPARAVALFNPKFNKGVLSIVEKEWRTGPRREQYRDTPGRYRKHYSQLLAGKRFEQGQQCEFKMTVIPYECTPENWVAAAEKLAGKREKK